MIPHMRPSERRALLLHAEGKTYQEIADALGRSRYTIRRQLDEARERWDARNVAHLLILAVRCGAVPLHGAE